MAVRMLAYGWNEWSCVSGADAIQCYDGDLNDNHCGRYSAYTVLLLKIDQPAVFLVKTTPKNITSNFL